MYPDFKKWVHLTNQYITVFLSLFVRNDSFKSVVKFFVENDETDFQRQLFFNFLIFRSHQQMILSK